MQEKFLLGIDAGTSVVKSVVYNLEGKQISLSRRRVAIETPKPGWAEQDMNKVWEMVRQTIVEVVNKAKISPSSIAAIGVAGQGDGCRLLDEKLRPVRPSILWLDGRAGEIVTQWEKKGIDREGFRISGSTIFSGAPAAIIKWLSLNDPDSLKKAKYFLFAKDWIKFKLTGKICTDPSDASRAPIDLKKLTYSEELFELFEISPYLSIFPEITFSGEIIGETTRNIASECNLKAGIPVISGMIDVVATPVGLGILEKGEAYTIVGTTCFSAVLSSRPLFEPPGVGMNLAYAFPDRYVRAMPSMAGTPNLDWFVDNFFLNEKKRFKEEKFYEFLEENVKKISPGSEGILYHPYINPGGERAPFVKPSAKAQFFGISLRHTKWHLLRAVYEGVALSVLDCFSHIPVEVAEVRISGGGATSSLWCQILSDVIGKPIHVSSAQELGTLGAAIAAGAAVGLYPDIKEAAKELVKFSHFYKPNMENHSKYLEIYRLYRSIYNHLWNDWDERRSLLRKLQEV